MRDFGKDVLTIRERVREATLLINSLFVVELIDFHSVNCPSNADGSIALNRATRIRRCAMSARFPAFILNARAPLVCQNIYQHRTQRREIGFFSLFFLQSKNKHMWNYVNLSRRVVVARSAHRVGRWRHKFEKHFSDSFQRVWWDVCGWSGACWSRAPGFHVK